MNELQSILNNREIAISIWIIVAAIIAVFTKPGKIFLKSTLPILFRRRFVVFYFAFMLYFCMITYFLYVIGFWSLDLLKDTIIWVLFVELPLFYMAIDKAKNKYFFAKLGRV